ncbi:MAG: dethiobiotin synthase [Burkholderiales bacterium]
MNGVFVGGTDTGVGKTRVAAALVRALRGAGVRAAGMKPIAAGIEPGCDVNDDVAALAMADGLDLPVRIRNPYAFADPIAPHLAARDAGTLIDLRTIAAAARVVASRADAIVVEGAGGVRVPVAPGLDMLDLARSLGLPVLLVVGVRLGCLNHALLSADAVAARGVVLAGWVANRIDPAMLRADDNVAELARLLPAPMLADVAWDAAPAFDARALSRIGVGPAPKAC